jgi:hypothetical protein
MYFQHTCEFWEHTLLNDQLDTLFNMQGTFDVSGHLAYCPVGRHPGVLPENTCKEHHATACAWSTAYAIPE